MSCTALRREDPRGPTPPPGARLRALGAGPTLARLSRSATNLLTRPGCRPGIRSTHPRALTLAVRAGIRGICLTSRESARRRELCRGRTDSRGRPAAVLAEPAGARRTPRSGGHAHTRLRSPYAWSMRRTGGQYLLRTSECTGYTAFSREYGCVHSPAIDRLRRVRGVHERVVVRRPLPRRDGERLGADRDHRLDEAVELGEVLGLGRLDHQRARHRERHRRRVEAVVDRGAWRRRPRSRRSPRAAAAGRGCTRARRGPPSPVYSTG